MKETLLTVKRRLRNITTWYGLASIVSIIITQIFGHQLPPNWEAFLITFFAFLTSLGVIADPENVTPLTWQSLKEAFRSKVVKTNLVVLLVFVITEWVAVWAGWDITVVTVITTSIVSLLSMFGIINNPQVHDTL